jgi:hypothetical protein
MCVELVGPQACLYLVLASLNLVLYFSAHLDAPALRVFESLKKKFSEGSGVHERRLS